MQHGSSVKNPGEAKTQNPDSLPNPSSSIIAPDRRHKKKPPRPPRAARPAHAPDRPGTGCTSCSGTGTDRRPFACIGFSDTGSPGKITVIHSRQHPEGPENRRHHTGCKKKQKTRFSGNPVSILPGPASQVALYYCRALRQSEYRSSGFRPRLSGGYLRHYARNTQKTEKIT